MAKKIAIVGAGWMAAYHVAGFRGAGAEVVAIVDKIAAAAKAASQKYGVDKTFGETKELYAAIKDLDAVSIITPTPSIIPWSWRPSPPASTCSARSRRP